jgi:hypothetical protein
MRVRAALLSSVAAVGLGCHPGVAPPNVPLYPNAASTRLPRSEVAELFGPIAKIDEQEVDGRGGGFELLPGCHVVELDRQMQSDAFSLSSGAYWSGQFPQTIYAMRMKAGARYVIRRDIISEGQTGRVVLSAREEAGNGATADLAPVQSTADVDACKAGGGERPAR